MHTSASGPKAPRPGGWWHERGSPRNTSGRGGSSPPGESTAASGMAGCCTAASRPTSAQAARPWLGLGKRCREAFQLRSPHSTAPAAAAMHYSACSLGPQCYACIEKPCKAYDMVFACCEQAAWSPHSSQRCAGSGARLEEPWMRPSSKPHAASKSDPRLITSTQVQLPVRRVHKLGANARGPVGDPHHQVLFHSTEMAFPYMQPHPLRKLIPFLPGRWNQAPCGTSR